MLTRLDPFRDVRSVEEALDRFVGHTFSQNTWLPAIDVKESEDRFEVTMDLPGLEPDQVEVLFEDQILTVRGTREFSDGGGHRALPPDRAQLRLVRPVGQAPAHRRRRQDRGHVRQGRPHRRGAQARRGQASRDRGQGQVTEDHERDETREPRIRITDRRRFASMTEEGDAPVSTEETGAEPAGTGAEEEATEVAGDLQAVRARARPSTWTICAGSRRSSTTTASASSGS